MVGIDLLLIGAAAVFAAIMLFGFVGCGLDLSGLGQAGDDYPTTILKTPGLVAYWRLQETSPPTQVPSSGGAAKCENNPAFNGDYFTLNPAPADEPHLSNETPGVLALGQRAVLLDLLPGSTNVGFDGGFMRVPFHAELNPSGAFTFEAWLFFLNGGPPPVNHPYYQCIVESSGPANLKERKSGWGLYLGPQDPSSPPSFDLFWLLFVFDNTNKFRQVATSPDKALIGGNPTYIALTYDGTDQWTLYFYVPNDHQDIGQASSVQAIPPTTVNGFTPNNSGDFFLGAGSNLFPAAGTPSQRLYPYVGSMQEVAFYNQDLSQGGAQKILGPHVMVGSSF